MFHRLITSMIVAVVLDGCSNTAFNSFDKKDDDDGDETTPSAQDKDSAKPSDDSEGVPGYLVDPELIAFERDGDGFEIRGQAGSIGLPSGNIEKVSLSVWNVDAANLPDPLLPTEGDISLPGEFITTSHPQQDGSFSIKVGSDAFKTHLALSTNSKSASKTVSYHSEALGLTGMTFPRDGAAAEPNDEITAGDDGEAADDDLPADDDDVTDDDDE